MTVDIFRAAYEAQPFEPFVLHLADGREIAVPSREFVYLLSTGRSVIVAKPNGGYNAIDLLLVTDLEFKLTGSGSGRRRRTSSS